MPALRAEETWKRPSRKGACEVHSEIPISESVGIGREPEAVRRGLIVKGIPGIERESFVGVAEAGEQRVDLRGRAGVGLTRQQGRPSSDLGTNVTPVGLSPVASRSC